MIRCLSLCFAFSATAAAIVPAFAQQVSPVIARQAIMKSVGAAAKVGAGIVQGDISFDPSVAAAVLMTFNAASHTYGDYFPEGSNTGETEASPKIWENPQGFQEKLAAFRMSTEAVVKTLPQDVDAFKAAFGQVAQNCKSCHESFRITKQ